MSKRDSSPKRFRIGCDRGHSRQVTATDLENLIQSGEFECSRCKHPLSLLEPEELQLECRICSDVFIESSLDSALQTIEGDCPSCNQHEFNDHSIHVPRSWQYMSGTDKWMHNGKGDQPLRRPDRTDYWEGVIHFCSATEFAMIYESGRIKASATGYFKVPAVCLSEATEGGWAELQRLHGDFGYVFHKRDILKLGGCPVMYLSPSMLAAQKSKGFADKVKPFVNVLRTKANAPGKLPYDYLHEREWRTARDIDLRHTVPYAVIRGPFDISTPGWDRIFDALMAYQELQIEQDT